MVLSSSIAVLFDFFVLLQPKTNDYARRYYNQTSQS
jgi:hypothetical protein